MASPIAVWWQYALVVPEVPIPEGERLAEVAQDAAHSGQGVYLTDRRERLATIVPARLAALLGCGSAVGGRRVLGACGTGRSGQRDISERIREILCSEVGR